MSPDPYSLAILAGLQYKPLYPGTVSPEEKARRRARGKRQRAARRAGRVCK